MGFGNFLGKILGPSGRPASGAAEATARQAFLGAILGYVVSVLSASGMDPSQVELVNQGLQMAFGALLLGGSALIGKLLRNWLVSRGGAWSILGRLLPLG